jgi:UDP-glucose 4-epimerase
LVAARAHRHGTAAHAEGVFGGVVPQRSTGPALALLQLTDELHHTTYNVASGHATSNAEVITALQSVEPSFQFELPSAGDRPQTWLDITRLREDTGFQPRYDTVTGAADYIAWLRAGNTR